MNLYLLAEFPVILSVIGFLPLSSASEYVSGLKSGSIDFCKP